MPTTKSNTLYDITIEGTYFAATPMGHQTTRPYTITVKMSQKMVDAGALSSFCKHLADDVLRAKYPDYIRFHTHEITNTVKSDGTPVDDIHLMNRQQLVSHITRNSYPIDINLYPDNMQLQQALLDYQNDEEAFIKSQKQLKEKRGDQLAIKAEAKELNATDTPIYTPGDRPRPDVPLDKLDLAGL